MPARIRAANLQGLSLPALLLACALGLPLRAAADPVKLPVGPNNGFVAVYVSYDNGATAYTNIVQLDDSRWPYSVGAGRHMPPAIFHPSWVGIHV